MPKNIAAKKTPKPVHALTGVAVPLGSLRTQESCGVGEYPDLIQFADFCKKSGLGIIQLLPVNDTGTESSPYSALSAFALHPLYACLSDFPEAESVAKKIAALKKKSENSKRFAYRQLRDEKLVILRAMYEANMPNSAENPTLLQWIENNDWVISYAVFMELKREHNEASWKEWKKSRLSKKEIEAVWNEPKKKNAHLFFAWLQMRLDEQFSKAAAAVREQGLILKGDIPILMNEDSCDIWAHPEYFSDTFRAGSPVDGLNPLGQNWGFPIYNWKNLAKDGYSWWKNRLTHAARYYDAYRIDHVLGFFRIWAVPETDFTAVLGHTEPYESITIEDLHKAGFDDGRIRWLSKPHIQTGSISAATGGNYDEARRQLSYVADKIGNEDLWLFKPDIKGERDIVLFPLSEGVKNRVCEWWRNRALLELENGCFAAVWTYKDSTAWQSLNQEEKFALESLFTEKKHDMEILWQKQAHTILNELTRSVSMLACAEDLGAGLDCMPQTLRDLGILSLRVLRWTRDWSKPRQPFVPLSEYPFLSVTTLSVHDSSTVRGWWLTEGDAEAFLQAFPPCETDGAVNTIKAGVFTPETALYLLKTAAKSASALCVHPLQDFLHLDGAYYDADSTAERVNIPGTVTDFNWTYRIPAAIEELQKNENLLAKIGEVAEAHKKSFKKIDYGTSNAAVLQ